MSDIDPNAKVNLSNIEMKLGEMVDVLNNIFKLHQNVEIKNTERFIDIKSLLTDIKILQETPLIVTEPIFDAKTGEEIVRRETHKIKHEVQENSSEMR